MMTYTTLQGKVLDLDGLTDEEREFFLRCVEAYRAGMGWDEFSDLVASTENPIVRAAGGLITNIVWDHPLFQAVSDLEDRVGILHGDLEPDPGTEGEVGSDPLADEWLPTTAAAERKGVSFSGLNQAIKRGQVLAKPAKPGGTHLLVSVHSLDRWQPVAVRQIAGRRRQARAAS